MAKENLKPSTPVCRDVFLRLRVKQREVRTWQPEDVHRIRCGVPHLTHLGYKVRYVRNITDAGHLTNDAGEGRRGQDRRARQVWRNWNP